MDIAITPRAHEKISQTAAREGVDLGTTYLRIGVVSGGCSGLTYDLGWDSALQESDRLLDLDGLQVVMDLKSFLYLAGTTLDFSDGLEGKGFHFDNPQASRTCACGESFSV